jgi:glycosyltransferase involved in cell wall biosynthesis
VSFSALFVTTVPATLEAFLLPFADHFRARGWRIDALANEATRRGRLLPSFDTLYDIGWSRSPLAVGHHYDTWNRVRRIVVEGGYDIVHVHTPIAAFVTRFALRSMSPADRPAIIYTAHGFHFYRGQGRLGHAVFRTLERTAAPWTDHLVTINREDYEAALAFRGISSDRVRLIPGIGVDTEAYSRDRIAPADAARVREELDVAADAFMLTMVAEFSPVKRHAHMLEALARTTHPDSVLVLVGEGPLEQATREAAVRLGIADRIRWAGYRTDVPAVLAASDALALVSAREGLPRSVLEAMSMALPVIGTATRGITDAVDDSVGWIVPKDDVSALARTIDHAASSPAECHERGQAARDRAVEHFALPMVLGMYEDLYERASAGRARAGERPA